MPPKGSKYTNQARRGLFRNGLSLNDVKLITALYYHIRLVRIPLLTNFTGKVVLTLSAKYTKIFVRLYGFGIQLITSSKMSTNRVTALEPYIPFIQDYSCAVYSWSRSLHILIRTSLLNTIFLAHLSRRLMGELIVYQSLRRPSSVRPSVRPQFQTSSPLKPLGQLNSNYIWRLLRMRERKFVQMVLVT